MNRNNLTSVLRLNSPYKLLMAGKFSFVWDAGSVKILLFYDVYIRVFILDEVGKFSLLG